MKCSSTGCGTGQLRTFTYDSLGRPLQASNPESGAVQYSYGSKAMLQSRTDARGVVTTYAYDNDNRLSSATYSDGSPKLTYTLDSVGNVTTATAATAVGNVVTNYPSYDAEQRPLSSNFQFGGQTYSFAYTYDLAGELLTETYPSGRVMTNTYDTAQRETKMTGALGSTTTPYVQQVGYYPSGAVYYWQYGNNLWPTEAYTKRLQPWYTNATINNSAGSYLLSVGNSTWNTNNTVGQSYEAFGTATAYSSLTFLYQNYGYDKLNRMTGMTDTNYSRTFQYDEYGNLSETGGNMMSGLMPGPTSFNTANNHVNGVTYDSSGNVKTTGSVTLWYDGEERETQTADTNGNQTISYIYDAFGQRVQKQIAGGAVTIDVYDAFGQLAAEYSTTAMTPAYTTCYLTYDQLGSIRMITDQNTNVVGRHSVAAYGDEIAGEFGRTGTFGVSGNVNQMFTGQERDGTTAQLSYFHARQYSAAMGMFMQPDPWNAGADITRPQSWNAYAYVLGNPLNGADPSGMCTVAFAGMTQSRDTGAGFTAVAQGLGAVEAYPFAGSDIGSSLLSVLMAPLGDISTQVALGALQYALNTNNGNVDILAYSGGAGAFSAAYGLLSATDQNRIGNILYVSPGASGALVTNGNTSVVRGQGLLDIGAMIGTGYPIGIPTEEVGCAHRDFPCLSNARSANAAFQAMEAHGSCASLSVFQAPRGVRAPGSATSVIQYGGGQGPGGRPIYQVPSYSPEGTLTGPGGWFPVPTSNPPTFYPR